MASLKEVIYKGRDNTNSVVFKEDGVAIDFSAVTRYELYLPATGVTIDTQATPGAITGNASGEVVFDLGAVDVSEGEYFGRLVAYDPAHTNGQVIVHEDRTSIHDRLILSFRDA